MHRAALTSRGGSVEFLTGVGRGTGRLVVVDEDYRSFGVSGEIVATVADHDPSMLMAPVQRVAVPDVPIPYAHSLEYAVLPRQDRIRQAVLRVLGT